MTNIMMTDDDCDDDKIRTDCSDCGCGDGMKFGVHEMTTMNIAMVISCTQSKIRNARLKYGDRVSYIL